MNVDFKFPGRVALSIDLTSEFFHGLKESWSCNPAYDNLRGANVPPVETIFKTFGRALRMAVVTHVWCHALYKSTL